METYTISSWDYFLKVISHIDVGEVGKVTYAFRRQPNSSWGLKPSLLRYFNDGVTAEEAPEIEKLGLAEFKSTAHLHMPQNLFSNTNDTTSLWAMMQHRGIFDGGDDRQGAATVRTVGHVDREQTGMSLLGRSIHTMSATISQHSNL
jgi:hypothetical protein